MSHFLVWAKVTRPNNPWACDQPLKGPQKKKRQKTESEAISQSRIRPEELALALCKALPGDKQRFTNLSRATASTARSSLYALLFTFSETRVLFQPLVKYCFEHGVSMSVIAWAVSGTTKLRSHEQKKFALNWLALYLGWREEESSNARSQCTKANPSRSNE